MTGLKRLLEASALPLFWIKVLWEPGLPASRTPLGAGWTWAAASMISQPKTAEQAQGSGVQLRIASISMHFGLGLRMFKRYHSDQSASHCVGADRTLLV